MDNYGLSYEEMNLLEKYGILSNFHNILNIIALYKYKGIFGKEKREETNKQVDYVLNRMIQEEKEIYGSNSLECKKEEFYAIIQKLLDNDYRYNRFDTEHLDGYASKIEQRSMMMNKYNSKPLLIECLIDLGLDSLLANNDAFIINLLTFLEEDIYSCLSMYSSSHNLADEYYEEFTNYTKDYLKSILKSILIIDNTEKEIKVQIKKIGNKYFVFDEEFLNSINEFCNWYIGADAKIYTFSFDKKNNYLSVTQSQNSFSRVKLDSQNKRVSEIITDSKAMVYDDKGKMIIDYGSKTFNIQELSSSHGIHVPQSGKPFSSYRLEAIPGTNKAHYILIENDETIIDTFDIDLIHDDVVIDLRFMRQFIGNPVEVLLDRYSFFKGQIGLSEDIEAYMRDKKIPYMSLEEDLYISKIADFNINILWRGIEHLVREEKRKMAVKKLKNTEV